MQQEKHESQLEEAIEKESDPIRQQQMKYENPFKNGSIRFDDYENHVSYENESYIRLENQVID